MTILDPETEVMLTGNARDVRFNPNYGLVVRDPGPTFHDERIVTILWEDGVERMHMRSEIVAWNELPKEIRPS